MGTKSKKENQKGLLPSSSFHPAKARGNAPRSYKKVTKFRDHLSKKR